MIWQAMKLTARPLAKLLMWLSCLMAAWQPCVPMVLSWLPEEEPCETREGSESSEESVLNEISLAQAGTSRWQRRHRGQSRTTVGHSRPRRVARHQMTVEAPLGHGSQAGRALPLHC